ncbi:MAG: DNA-binding protein WhiA [Clostridia bacterium]
MSYSSDFKKYCSEIEIKKTCCRIAYEDGLELRKPRIHDDCDIGAYIRGAFVACGSITDPNKHYYISFSADQKSLSYIKGSLAAIGIEPADGMRKGNPILYLRDSTKIEDFLSLTGATKYTLELINIKIKKDLRAVANRQTNADFANFDKAASAATIQINAINKLKKQKNFHNLSDELKNTANIRIKYPELSLSELKDKFCPPISKSGLNHRLNKIIEISEISENS